MAMTSGRCGRRPLAAVDHARSGYGPAFIEAMTYRFVGHSRSDPGKYRKPGELDAWKLRDPLLIAAGRLSADFGVSDEAIAAVQKSVEDEMSDVMARGLAAPWPSASRSGTEFKEARTCSEQAHAVSAGRPARGGPRGARRGAGP